MHESHRAHKSPVLPAALIHPWVHDPPPPDTIIRSPQNPFAEISATPTAELDRIREIMLVWSQPRGDETAAGDEAPVADEDGGDDE